MFSLIRAWINGWVNNLVADDLRCHRPDYDVTVMFALLFQNKPANMLTPMWWNTCGMIKCVFHKGFEVIRFWLSKRRWFHFRISLRNFPPSENGHPSSQLFGKVRCQHRCLSFYISWWRHQMETFSALLAICAGNSPASVEFPAQRPVTRSFDVSFDLCLNKRLRKQSWDALVPIMT